MGKDKEWLKEKVRENANHYPTYHDERDDLVKKMVDMHGVLKLIDQLDEPEKVVIPQFVADWIRECKINKHNLYGVYHFAPSEVSNWGFNDRTKKERTNLIARAWLDGYTIEPQKTYRFTLNAFHEIDVNATSLGEAQKEAEKTWNQYFVRNRDFGEAEFEGEVDEEGELEE